LNKGLKFAPTNTNKISNFTKDVEHLTDTLQRMTQPYDYTIPSNTFFKNPNPKPNPNTHLEPDSNIHQYKELTLTTAREAFNADRKRKDNLTISERTTLNKLKKRKDIVIKKADKGDTIVVETLERYVQDGFDHLNNLNIYQPVNKDINLEITQTINKFLEDALNKGLIDYDTFEAIKPCSNPRTPIIYFLKKLHKNPISVRPIVSSINSPTSNLSNFIDILLKPIVKTFPHILPNTTQLLLDIETIIVPDHAIIASLDVTSLYTNIPTDEGIEIILKYLDNYKEPHYPPIELLKQILIFVLKYNCFIFCDLFFLQIQGVAMGTKMAPNFANIFMADFEEKHILNKPKRPMLYRRYIDDIFIIWTDTLTELEQLINNINQCHSTIKMTSELSKQSINYLDLTITIENNKLKTTSYFKPTNTFSYLPGTSHHPKATKNGIFKGEMIRMLRNNSDQEHYQQQTDFIRQKFKDRNYHHSITIQEIPDFNNRTNYLSSKKKESKYLLTLSTDFDPSLSISTIINQHWPILFSNETLRQKLPSKPRISYRAPRTLGKILTRAHIKTSLQPMTETITPTVKVPPKFPAKTISCRVTNCSTCQILSNKCYFTSYQTKQYFKINNIYSCDTSNAIYLLECSICFKQYVGETGTTVRIRMRHHRNMFNSYTNRPIYRHPVTHSANFAIYRLTIIDQVNNRDRRKAKEADWIKILKTKLPFGFNVIQKQ